MKRHHMSGNATRFAKAVDFNTLQTYPEIYEAFGDERRETSSQWSCTVYADTSLSYGKIARRVTVTCQQ